VGPVTEQSEHLSSAQIENYGIRTSGAGPEAIQRDEHQRVNHQSIDDQSINDPRVEAHLADCASCRNSLLEFHRNLFASSANLPEPDRPKANDTKKANDPKNDPKNDPHEHDASLSGHSPSDDSSSGYSSSGYSSSGHSASGHLSSGQRPADSSLLGASPTDSALADSKFANPNDPADPQVRTAPTPECPSTDELRELAAGLLPGSSRNDALATRLLQHAATCDHCGPLLRTFTDDFSDDFSAEEQAALNSLQSASPAWQEKTARKMLQESTTLVVRDSSSKLTNWSAWKWVPAFSFLLLVAAGATWVYPLLILHKASFAVEAEYRKGRPMEYRVSGVPYGPYVSELGGRGITSIIEVPNPERAPLLAANAALLHEDYASAKSILENALKKERSLSLLNNLAVAYAMEADHIQPANEEDKKRQQKVYLLGLLATEEVLRQNSFDAAALFNRALILDRIGRGSEAPPLLKQIKQVEQDTGWRQEAEEKLQLMH